MPFTLVKRSQFTGKLNKMVIPMDVEVFEASREAWEKGMMIQHAFPTLTSEQREFVKTGCTPEEWADIFGPEEE